MLLLNPFVGDAGLAAVVSQLILSFLMRSGFSTLTLADFVTAAEPGTART
jgi:hypothetical protein